MATISSFLRLLYQYRSFLISGIEVTVIVSICSIILGMIFGILFSIGITGKNKIIKGICRVYVEIVRGTPVLVIIAMVFYGLPLIGLKIPDIKFQAFTLDRMLSGILALTISCSAYICEILRGGIEAVDFGQQEAAKSLGFTRKKSFWIIIFPQALRTSLPALANEFVDIIKASSQVSVIALADVMYITNMIRSNSFKAFAPYVIAVIIYLVLTNICAWLMKRLEKHFNNKFIS